MHEGTWFALNQRIQTLKNRYCPTGHTFELHVKQFAVEIREQDQIPDFENMSWTERQFQVLQIRQNRIDKAPNQQEKTRLAAKYRKTAPFIHLTRAERSRLLGDALDLVGGHDGIHLFAEAIAKNHPAVVAQHVDPVQQAFTQMVSRFDAFLQRRHRWKLARTSRASMDNGLLVLDEDHSTESDLRNRFDAFREYGHPWGQLRHVIDVPFFASSQQLGGLQLADVCVYALRRYLDTDAIPDSHEEYNFLRVFHRFDRENAGKLHGLRHFVPAGSCNCLICRERGHAPAQSGRP
jgi:hypothetical protein